MRSLYLKQLKVLTQEEGMTLKAYGVPVTYEGVIKFLLWSSTLIFISYSSETH